MHLRAANGFAVSFEESGSLKHCMHLCAAALCFLFSLGRLGELQCFIFCSALYAFACCNARILEGFQTISFLEWIWCQRKKSGHCSVVFGNMCIGVGWFFKMAALCCIASNHSVENSVDSFCAFCISCAGVRLCCLIFFCFAEPWLS